MWEGVEGVGCVRGEGGGCGLCVSVWRGDGGGECVGRGECVEREWREGMWRVCVWEEVSVGRG